MTAPLTEQEIAAAKTTAKPLVIYGGPLWDGQNNIFEDGAVYVSKGKIISAGTEETVFENIPKTVDIEVYDAQGGLILPGFVNLRHSLQRTFGLGLPAYEPNANSLKQMEQFWWKYDQCLDEEMVQLAVLYGMLTAIEQGTTTLFNLHSSPLQISKILNNIASGVTRAGLRIALGYEISARYGEDVFNRALAENQRFASESPGNALVQAMPGLQYDQRLSDKMLVLVKASIKKGSGLQIEMTVDGALKRLDSCGLITSGTTLTGIFPLDKESLDIIRKNDATYVFTAGSPVDLTQPSASSLNLGLGSAGQTDSLLQILQRELIPRPPGDSLIPNRGNLITSFITGNSRFAGQFFPGKPGVIADGSDADIVVLDYTPVAPITTDNFHQHLLFGLPSAVAKMVMVQGKFIFNDDSFLTIDKELIITESQKAFKRLSDKFAKL